MKPGVIRTGGAPAAAAGPDITQLFVGSEGTLGVITRAWLRTHPVPEAEQRAAFSFASWSDGVEACPQAPGVPVGVLDDFDYQDVEVQLQPGDRLGLLPPTLRERPLFVRPIPVTALSGMVMPKQVDHRPP